MAIKKQLAKQQIFAETLKKFCELLYRLKEF